MSLIAGRRYQQGSGTVVKGGSDPKEEEGSR